jgi:preprotein translocase subunit SecG
MENVVLVIHLILALVLIGVVLMQRSEGGGLGMGGGGGGVMSNRSAATALAKLTWFLAIGFICTSIALTIIAAEKSAGVSVIDRLTDQTAPEAEATTEAPDAGTSLGTDLLPPSADENTPIVPPAN